MKPHALSPPVVLPVGPVTTHRHLYRVASANLAAALFIHARVPLLLTLPIVDTDFDKPVTSAQSLDDPAVSLRRWYLILEIGLVGYPCMLSTHTCVPYSLPAFVYSKSIALGASGVWVLVIVTEAHSDHPLLYLCVYAFHFLLTFLKSVYSCKIRSLTL